MFKSISERCLAALWGGRKHYISEDKVWVFLRTYPGLSTDGHNVFLYHHPARCDLPMDVDFGVEVTRTFESAWEVYATETPAGIAAVAVHVGAYDRIKETHDAIHAWREARHDFSASGHSAAGAALLTTTCI
jgi:hypothetical protein